MKESEFFQGKYPIWIVFVVSFPVVCGTSHNSSWLESYGHEKLETPGLGNGPKFVGWIII